MFLFPAMVQRLVQSKQLRKAQRVRNWLIPKKKSVIDVTSFGAFFVSLGHVLWSFQDWPVGMQSTNTLSYGPKHTENMVNEVYALIKKNSAPLLT